MTTLPSFDTLLRDLIDDMATDAEVLDLRVGAHFTCLQTSSGTGLASTLRSPCRGKRSPAVRDAGNLLERGPLTHLATSASLLEASIGVASLTSNNYRHLDKCVDINATTLIERHGAGKHIAVIGSFPFAQGLRNIAKNVSIFERAAHRAPGELGEKQMADVLPTADVVAISATTLINHTLMDIWQHVSPNAFKVMLGPSTPLSPVLFALGFDALSTSIVHAPKRALISVSQGANFKQIQGIRLMTWSANNELA